MTDRKKEKKINGHPIQIIDIEMTPNQSSRMNLTGNLKHITQEYGEKNVALISIAGPSRQGKSFLLSFIIRYLAALEKNSTSKWLGKATSSKPLVGFPFQNCLERQTIGLWLWSRPFLIKNEKGEEIAVFVMDTQGVFDEHTTSREWSAIVGLSLLTSSCLIYNVVQNLQEDVLQILETFIQYGMLAMKEDETGEKCFQKLTFLIRDWNMPDECDYGPLGGQKFLDHRLKLKDHLPKASVRIRETMKSCFEELSCFLMPDPGKTAKGNDFKGSLKELDPNFIECLTSLMDTLLSPEQIKVKKVGGQPLKGKNLAQIFQRYVGIFNSDEMPSTVCLLDATAHSVCETMVAKILDKFAQEFQDNMEICGFINAKEFNSLNEMLTKAALMDFDRKKKFGDEKIAKKHRRRLETDLSKLTIQMKDENERKKNEKSSDIQEKLLGGFSTMFLDLVQKEYILHEELDELINHETEKILAEFCNSFDNNKTILEDQVPTFNSKIMNFVHSLHAQNDEKINKTKEIARSIVEVCYSNYENDLNFKLLQAPNSILDDDFIIAVEAILRKQAITSFDSKFQIPCEKVSQQFKTELEILMNAKLEEIGKKNSGKKSEQILRVEALIENIVNLYQTDIATALNQEISPNKAFLQNQHLRLYQKYNDLFLSQAGISDLNILTPFIQNLNVRLNSSLDEANAQLINLQNEIKLNVESQIEQIRKDYHNNMMEVLTAKTVCTEEELKTKHLNFIKMCDKNFQSPDFLNNLEKDELRCRLLDALEQEFEILSTEYQNKLYKYNTDLNKEIENVLLEYKNRMEKYLDEVSDVSQIETKHKEVAHFLDDVMSQKVNFLPQDMELQHRQRLDQLFSKEFETISDKFVTKKLETEQQVALIYNQCFTEYTAEIHEKMLDVSEEKLLKQWHDFIRNRCANQFAMKVQSFNLDHTETKLKLENQICKSFDDLLKANEERLLEQEENAEALIENSLEAYKQSMEEILMADCCENEPDFQQREKMISLSCFTKYEGIGANVPINIFKQKKQILNIKMETERQAYLDIFRQKVVNNLEAKQKFIPEILSAYKKLMEDFIQNNSKVHISKLQEMHEIFSNSAVENVPSSIFKYIFNEVKSHLQQSYCTYENHVKTEHVVREKMEESIAFWKVKIDTEIQTHSLNISDECELSTVQCSLIEEWKTKLREANTFDERRIRGIHAELERYLEEACNKAKSNIMKKETDSNIISMVRNTALQVYEKEMSMHLGPSDFVNPNVLENFHQQSTEIALQDIRNKKIVTMSPSITKDLTLLFDHSFSKYRDINSRNTPVKPAIGIDLGTTFTCVAVYNAGRVTIIPNENGKNTTPSYVAFNKKGVETVGESAKSQSHLNPENTIFDAKRLIGRTFDDPIVQTDIKQWPFKVIDFSGVPKIQVNKETYWPEEISAKLLKKMKQMAEKHLNCTVENAVITVPAYFNDGQKKATMDAGKFAGLNVLGILNEPTAAAVAYSLNYACEKSRKVLIFDFGGGTFDIAVLEIHNGKIDAKAVDGDTHLGGEDFDSNLVNYCVQKFKAETNFDLLADQNSENLNIRNDVSRRIKRLRGECERQKINLTGSFHATINVEAIYEKIDLKVEVSRETFEDINKELLDKAMEIVERALEHAKIIKSDIDDIVLVGGSTRIPRVQSLLKTYFNGKALNLNINADEAVAQGAAIYASILNGDQAVKLRKIHLTDVTPLSIGVEANLGKFSTIISKNTPIPTKMIQTYRTFYENQTCVEIKIYEGESEIASNNHLLGVFELDGIPEGPAGSQEIKIIMKVNVDGILNVEAFCSGGNVSKDLTIIKNKGKLTGGLSNK